MADDLAPKGKSRELMGHHRRRPRLDVIVDQGSASSARSDFPAENLLVFIPLRVVAAEFGAAPSAARCFRPARAADFVLVELLIGAAGRGWSSGDRAVGSYGVERLCRRAIERPGGLCVVCSLRLSG